MLFTENDDLIRIKKGEYGFQAHNDYDNERLWVFAYTVEDHKGFAQHLQEQAQSKNFSKIIIPAKDKDIPPLLAAGFRQEAEAKGFFSGQDASFLAYYLKPERGQSRSFFRELEVLSKIQEKPLINPVIPQKEFTFRQAKPSDIPELAQLFGTVFRSYPSPIDDPDYLKLSMRLGTIFRIAQLNGHIIGAAAAEIDRGNKNAEMTDFATHPDYRGQGLATYLLADLEEICAQAGFTCLWSLSRAGSYGINLVFHRLGYQHGGTLVNNAYFGDYLENLHLWFKYPVR